ncbi:MAG: SDR family oxidoreductase [Acidobacteriaceae bacterium]|nr:SDR family oxidoreductase [Acidobacteriaceae bacterium]MBV9780230.1 SDR family oxidoreductase [Acidobacteriaceae bacterium]
MKLFVRNSRGPLDWLMLGTASAAGLFLTGKIVRKLSVSKLDLRDKIVLITGGSRGLGLCLGFELGNRGARLALCARDQQELEEARNRLAARGIEAAVFPCDISDESQISPLVGNVLDRYGRIDVLVNNAGHIIAAPFESFDHSDFERAMNVMFWAPVNLSFAVLPLMKQQRSGSIVNITSIGGRVSVPHLLPYCCAKYAFVGFSNGLGAEVKSQGIHVLTAIPGLMRTGSYLNAQFKGSAEREFAWFGLLGNLPGFSVAASYAARCIVNALETNRHTCTISLPAKFLMRAEALFPETTQRVFSATSQYLLPAPNGEKVALSGKILNNRFNRVFQALTALGKSAALQLNE